MWKDLWVEDAKPSDEERARSRLAGRLSKTSRGAGHVPDELECFYMSLPWRRAVGVGPVSFQGEELMRTREPLEPLHYGQVVLRIAKLFFGIQLLRNSGWGHRLTMMMAAFSAGCCEEGGGCPKNQGAIPAGSQNGVETPGVEGLDLTVYTRGLLSYFWWLARKPCLYS